MLVVSLMSLSRHYSLMNCTMLNRWIADLQVPFVFVLHRKRNRRGVLLDHCRHRTVSGDAQLHVRVGDAQLHVRVGDRSKHCLRSMVPSHIHSQDTLPISGVGLYQTDSTWRAGPLGRTGLEVLTPHMTMPRCLAHPSRPACWRWMGCAGWRAGSGCSSWRGCPPSCWASTSGVRWRPAPRRPPS